jgi:hypothetical protein
LNGQEHLQAQVSVSKVKSFPAYHYDQHLEDCKNNGEDNKFIAFPRNEKVPGKQE